MAVSIFNLSYSDSTIQAFSLLNKKLLDFNNKTVMELAHISQNKHFISHPCCQRWLQKKMNGKLEIREISRGSVKFPVWLKIYLCAFLVFPMFFWIHFDSKAKDKKKSSKFQNYVKEEDEELNQSEMSPLTRKMSDHPSQKVVVRGQGRIATRRCGCDLPIWERIYLLWSAPITKFWISQLFYLIYLMLFSLAVILPTCGNLYLDLVIFFWTLLIWVDIMRRIFIKINKYPELSVFWSWVEVAAIGFYLLLFLMFRIIAHAIPYTDYTTMKTMMSLGLIYFYYRTLVIFLPISPELGPMLVNISRMVRRDFFTWMRMFLIFMISGGITVQAVLYPNFPLSKEVIKRAFSRAMFAMFLTKIDDLDGDPQCTYLYDQGRLGYCGYENDPNITDAIRDALSTCPHDSPGGYIILIQYLLITKLVLITLLYAMFSATIARVSSEATQIWKFQRYGLIVDFEERLCLPPPLCLISYIWLILSFIGRQCRTLYNMSNCRRCTQNDTVDQMILTKIKRSADYNYWKICTKQFSVLEEEEVETKERGKNQSNMMQNVMEDLRKQEKSNKKLEEKIIHLEKGLTTSLLLLEEMKHMIGKLDPKSHGIVMTSPTIHLASRQSPYPGTNHQRFPVFDKFVPWEVAYEAYDPILYSKPAMEFDIDIQPYVDINILQFKMSEEEDRKFTSEANVATVSFPHPDYMSWNCARTEGRKYNAIEVDRTSWITKGGQTVRYELDTVGLPLNSQGRTGIRGHGSLCRWGPNHIIQAVLTRWKKYSISRPQDYLVLDGKRVLEFLAIKNGSGECYLPGGNVYGSKSMYSVLCASFKRSVLKDEGADVTTRLDEDDMISFFAEFVVSKSHSSRFTDRSPTIVPGFSSQVMYRGYLDDPQNTDNAWMEAEVWNFHYSLGNSLDDKMKDGKYEWKKVSPYLRLHGNQASIVQEAARLHDAFY